MQNFTKQNKLFFIKNFIFCLFFLCSYQNIFAMQEEVDITKYAGANIADPRIEVQFLKDLLAIKNNTAEGAQQTLMQKLHDRLKSVLNKKKENGTPDIGEINETQNAINIAIKRNLISPVINEIYELIKNLKKEDFDVFANIRITEELSHEPLRPIRKEDFSHKCFKNIFKNLEREHNKALLNLKNLAEKGFGSFRFSNAINMYKEKLDFIMMNLDLTRQAKVNRADDASEIYNINQEFKKIESDIKQKSEFFEATARKTEREVFEKERQERLKKQEEDFKKAEDRRKKWEQENKEFLDDMAQREKKRHEQEKTRKQQEKDDAQYSLKNDPVIQELLAQFEHENLIFLEKAEKYKSPLYSLDYAKTKNDFLKILNEIETKIRTRSSEIRVTSSYTKFNKICEDESKIFDKLWKQYNNSMNILSKNNSIRTNKQINIAVITTTLALTIGYVTYYSHNKNKECKQDLELILNKLKNKLSQEKIEQLVKKRSAFFQKYLPIWTKRMFGMQCDWKKYLNKISNLSQEELEKINNALLDINKI